MSARRFFEAVYRDNAERKRGTRRTLRTDVPLYLKNRLLEPIDVLLRRRYRDAGVPVVFIVGAPRSGTTVLHQLVAEYLDVGFINNRMSRYFAAPVLGALLHGKLGRRHSLELASEHGRTRGDDAPHEFSWFWHYYGDFARHDDLTDAELAAIDWTPIQRSLEGLAGYFRRPVVLKNINFVVYQIAWLKGLLPSAKFISIQRDERFTVQSIVRAREREYGDRSVWWSVRPRDHDHWLDRTPVEQAAYQVADVRRAVDEGFSALARDDRLEVHYEALVTRPRETLTRIAAFLGTRVVDPERLEALVLTSRNEKTIDDDTWTQIQAALAP